MKISLGVAKCIAHIHSASGWKLFHGNISSSNVLVTADLQFHISDLGLTSLVSDPSKFSGKEGQKTRYMGMMSDVYNFGLLLFEMLTGKSTEELDDDAIGKGGCHYWQSPMMGLAEACVNENLKSSPCMDWVVRKLENISASEIQFNQSWGYGTGKV